MNNPLQTLLSLNAAASRFPAESRYNGIPTATHVDAEGREIPYLLRRFVPAPERFALLQEHIVTDGERLDQITARYLGNPELFWRICDANRAMRPEELTEEAGRSLRITMPEGLPGGIDE